MISEKISVIVPVYNVEHYLEKCIKSVINQSYQNIELILVNDGSNDNSGEICEKYEKEYQNVKYYCSENKGVSNARNIGLENMTGEYFIFIDSDDYIKNNMLEVLYNNIKSYNADISICNVVKINEDGTILKLPLMGKQITLLDREEYQKLLYNTDIIHGYPINKLIKKEVLQNEKFDENIKHLEDWDFLCRTSKNANVIVYDSRNYYYYYVNRKNSAVHQEFNDSWTTDLIAREKNMKIVEKYNDKDRVRFLYDYTVTSLKTIGLFHFEKKLTPDIKNHYLYQAKKYYKQIINKKYLTKYEKIKLFFQIRMPIIYFKITK